MADERLQKKLAELDEELAEDDDDGTTTKTREKLAQAERRLVSLKVTREMTTTTRTKERLQDVERQLAAREDTTMTMAPTTTRTRERLVEMERQLAMRGEPSKTTTRTRDRLEAANAELARYTMGPPSSTRTREKLAIADKQLAATTTRTRDLLHAKMAELEKMKTSTTTKEKLRLVDADIRRQREKETSSYTLEMFKKKQLLLRKMLEQNKDVDVAFMLDCTGSMASYINETKGQIKKIVSEITEMYDNTFRVAFVGYRDHCDGPNRIESLGFTENVDEFIRFVTGVAAKGGGDAPEDVLGGLEATINLAWSSGSKVIFHIGDAPQHGSRFHDLGGDSHPGDDPRGLKAEDLFRNLKQIGVRYFFGKINNSTDKMFKVFQELGGREMVNDVNMKSPNLLQALATTSICSTIEGTLSATVDLVRAMKAVPRAGGTELTAVSEVSDGGKTLKDYCISDIEPDEADLEPQKKVHWLKCVIRELETVSNIQQHIGSINHQWSNQMVKKARQPFSEGTQRISFHGLDMNYAEGGVHEKVVLKEFKYAGAGRDRRTDYIEIMETQCVAAFMAMEFTKVAPPGSKQISFLKVRCFAIIFTVLFFR